MRLSRCLLFTVASLCFVGCRADESIQQYEVTHIDREKISLRVAIIPHEKYVWIFHLSGPTEEVETQAKVLETLVSTVRFEEKKDESLPIVWDEPKAAEWVKDPAVGERIANYRIQVKPKAMEMKVTVFPLDKYTLIANVHRWQQIMNMPICDEKDVGQFATTAKVGANEVTWVKLQSLGVHLAAKKSVPVALNKRKGGMPMFGKKDPPAKQGSGDGDVPFDFKAPAGWQRQKPRDSFTRVLFEVNKDGKTALVTLSAVGGGLPANIARWRGQLGLPPISNEEAIQSTKAITVAGMDGKLVDLMNPKSPTKVSRIVVAMVPTEETTWFIRMSGQHEWVGQNMSAFDEFLKSFKKAGK